MLYPGNLLKLSFQRRKESRLLLICLVDRARKSERPGHNAVRLKTGFYFFDRAQTTHQKAGAEKQQHGDCDLNNHQRGTGPLTTGARGLRAATFL